MQLSLKGKTFSQLLCAIFEMDIKLPSKRRPSQLMYFRNIGFGKPWLDKCLKSPLSEYSSKSNMVNGPKHCSNLNHSIFSIFIDQCEYRYESRYLDCFRNVAEESGAEESEWHVEMIQRGSSKAIQKIILITVIVTMIMILITIRATRSMRLKICDETFCCYPSSIDQVHICNTHSSIFSHVKNVISK